MKSAVKKIDLDKMSCVVTSNHLVLELDGGLWLFRIPSLEVFPKHVEFYTGFNGKRQCKLTYLYRPDGMIKSYGDGFFAESFDYGDLYANRTELNSALAEEYL